MDYSSITSLLNSISSLFNYSREKPSQFNLLGLPNEIIMKILSDLSLRDLLNTCQSNRTISQLCKSDLLWKLRVERQFPDEMDKHRGITWKDHYFYLLLKHTFIETNIDFYDENFNKTSVKTKIYPYTTPLGNFLSFLLGGIHNPNYESVKIYIDSSTLTSSCNDEIVIYYPNPGVFYQRYNNIQNSNWFKIKTIKVFPIYPWTGFTVQMRIDHNDSLLNSLWSCLPYISIPRILKILPSPISEEILYLPLIREDSPLIHDFLNLY